MKSITIHKLDDETERALVGQAAREGVSLNHLVKRLLRQILGVGAENRNRKVDFEGFCGRWSEKEGDEFDELMLELGEIDEEIWQ